jgi:hypothetical protein
MNSKNVNNYGTVFTLSRNNVNVFCALREYVGLRPILW